MAKRVFLSVTCLSLVLVAQQVGLAQSNYSPDKFDESWRLIGEDRTGPRAGRCRHDRYRDRYRRTSRTAVEGDDWSRSPAAVNPYTTVTRSSQPMRYATNSAGGYQASTVRSPTRTTTSAATARPPTYNARSVYSVPYVNPSPPTAAQYGAQVQNRAPVQYRPPVQNRAPLQYRPPVQYNTPVQFGSAVPAQQNAYAYSNAASWPRYDGARSYPVTTAGYRSGSTAGSRYYYGTSIYGSPMIYAKDQPVRNWLRSLLP